MVRRLRKVNIQKIIVKYDGLVRKKYLKWKSNLSACLSCKEIRSWRFSTQVWFNSSMISIEKICKKKSLKKWTHLAETKVKFEKETMPKSCHSLKDSTPMEMLSIINLSRIHTTFKSYISKGKHYFITCLNFFLSYSTECKRLVSLQIVW